MSDQSLLVRLPESVHAQLKKAAAAHKLSMQKVVAALVEGWIDSGSPPPVQCRISDDSNSDVVDSYAVDKMARESIIALDEEIQALRQQLSLLDKRLESPVFRPLIDDAKDFNEFHRRKMSRNELLRDDARIVRESADIMND